MKKMGENEGERRSEDEAVESRRSYENDQKHCTCIVLGKQRRPGWCKLVARAFNWCSVHGKAVRSTLNAMFSSATSTMPSHSLLEYMMAV